MYTAVALSGALDFRVDGLDGLFQHAAVRRGRRAAEVILGAFTGQLQHSLPFQAYPLFGGEFRPVWLSTTGSLLLLRFDLFGLEAARHLPILRSDRCTEHPRPNL